MFIPGLSEETQRLAQFVGDKEGFGSVVTYPEITEIIGKDSQIYRSSMSTVIRRERREKGRVWANIFRVGYKLLDDKEILAKARGHNRKAYRQHGKTITNLDVADSTKLDTADSNEKEMLKITSALIRSMSGRVGHKKIAAVFPKDGNSKLPDKDAILKLFSK